MIRTCLRSGQEDGLEEVVDALVEVARREVFVPVTLSAQTTPTAAEIRLAIKRGTVSVDVVWPVASASACAAWLRDVLR